MKLLTTPTAFTREFGRLIKHYRHLDWAVAWATNRHESFDLLLKNRRKIRRIVVGTQFHQTAPEFIDAFKSVPEVRFRIDQEGLSGIVAVAESTQLRENEPDPVRVLLPGSKLRQRAGVNGSLGVEEMMAHKDKTAHTILGAPDDLKFRSCLTLFLAVAAPDDSLWQDALDQFYAGKPDETTLRLLASTPPA